jgi:hypothetical protein
MLLLTALAWSSAPVPPPIVGGSPAPDGRWPDAVAFVDPWGNPFCTGTLVAPDLVVTAAHCVDDYVGSVRIGSVAANAGGALIRVTRIQKYPDWENTFDVAFVTLAEEAPYPPRRPAVGCVAEDIVDDATVVVAGWGMTREDGTGETNTLRQVETFIQDADCNALTMGCQRRAWPAGELIAGGDGESACYGVDRQHERAGVSHTRGAYTLRRPPRKPASRRFAAARSTESAPRRSSGTAPLSGPAYAPA